MQVKATVTVAKSAGCAKPDGRRGHDIGRRRDDTLTEQIAFLGGPEWFRGEGDRAFRKRSLAVVIDVSCMRFQGAG